MSVAERFGFLVPISTTSFKATPSSRETKIFPAFETTTSCVLYPTEDTTIVTGKPVMFNLKLPSKSVVVPLVVPLIITFAPGKGSFVFAIETVPVRFP